MIRIAAILAILLCIVVGGGLTLVHFLRPSVTVTEAVDGPVVQAFYSTGTIQPVREYPIKSNTAGLLSDVRVDKGDRVKKGDILAAVVEPTLTFASHEAQAMLDEKLARAQPDNSPVLKELDAKLAGTNDLLEIAKREQKRITDLLEHNAGSQADLDRALDRVKQLSSDAESFKAQRATKVLETRREVDVAKAALDVANWNLAQQTMTAPIDGVILDRPLALRTRVAINDAIMRLADVAPENLVMRAAVDEEDVANVRIGQAVRMTLYAFPGKAFRGNVEKIYDQADADRRTFEVDVKLDQVIPQLQAGMTGELAFIIAEKSLAVIVPAQALQADGSMLVVRNGSSMTREFPTVGLKSIERVEVISGIAKGDTVVISPVKSDEPNEQVRTTRVDPRIAAGLNKPDLIEKPANNFGK